MLVPPRWRCTFFTPCVARWPLKLCRRMTPEVPRPLLVPVTSTCLTFSNRSTFSNWPMAIPSMVPAEFADKALRLAIGFGLRLDARLRSGFAPLGIRTGDLAAGTAAGEPPGLVEIADLDRFVAVPLLRAQLQHVARAGLNDRHRNGRSGFVENLSHPTLRPSSPIAIARNP